MSRYKVSAMWLQGKYEIRRDKMESFPLWRGVQPREPAWKRAKNQGCSRGSVGKQRFRRCESANEEETEGKGRGIGEKAGEKKEREKKRTANPWVNVTTGWCADHSTVLPLKGRNAIDRCFTTKVIRVFARPLFSKTRSFRHDTAGPRNLLCRES